MKERTRERRRPNQYLVVDPQPLRSVGAVALLRMLDRTAAVRAIGTVGDLCTEPAPASYRLVILNLGSAPCAGPTIEPQIATLRERLPGTPLVVMADGEGLDDVRGALHVGAEAFISTLMSPRVAVGALQLVLVGGTYFPSTAVEMAPVGMPHKLAPSPVSAPLSWTEREWEVAKHLRHGQPNKVIAGELKIELSTVKLYVRRVINKLAVSNRTEAAVRLAQIAGMKVMNGQPSLSTISGSHDFRMVA